MLLLMLRVTQGCCCVVTDVVSLRDVAVFVAEVGMYGIMLQSLACH